MICQGQNTAQRLFRPSSSLSGEAKKIFAEFLKPGRQNGRQINQFIEHVVGVFEPRRFAMTLVGAIGAA